MLAADHKPREGARETKEGACGEGSADAAMGLARGAPTNARRQREKDERFRGPVCGTQDALTAAMAPVRTLALATIFGAASLFCLPDAQAKRGASGWMVTSSDGRDTLHEGQGFDLELIKVGFIQVQNTRGQNLAFSERRTRNVRFAKKGGGPIRCGDRFAIAVDTEYLVYGDQAEGTMDLTTRTERGVKTLHLEEEIHQWTVGGCLLGDPVSLKAPIALTNTRVNDAVVACRRRRGLQLCWDDRQRGGVSKE